MKIKKNKHKFRHEDEKKKITEEPKPGWPQLQQNVVGGSSPIATTQAAISTGIEERFKKRHQEGKKHHHHY